MKTSKLVFNPETEGHVRVFRYFESLPGRRQEINSSPSRN
jgi:hypothetical protein